MAGRPRTTFDKLQKERSRQEKQAAKRARRQGTSIEGGPGPVMGWALPDGAEVGEAEVASAVDEPEAAPPS